MVSPELAEANWAGTANSIKDAANNAIRYPPTVFFIFSIHIECPLKPCVPFPNIGTTQTIPNLCGSIGSLTERQTTEGGLPNETLRQALHSLWQTALELGVSSPETTCFVTRFYGYLGVKLS